MPASCSQASMATLASFRSFNVAGSTFFSSSTCIGASRFFLWHFKHEGRSIWMTVARRVVFFLGLLAFLRFLSVGLGNQMVVGVLFGNRPRSRP